MKKASSRPSSGTKMYETTKSANKDLKSAYSSQQNSFDNSGAGYNTQ